MWLPWSAATGATSAVRSSPEVASEADVRELALVLPETIEKPSYGTPGFRVRDRLFARLREDPDALVLWRESEEEKLALIESEPEKFFTTPHYDGYANILLRLDAVDRQELAELLEESWRFRGGQPGS
jgi:hypothetical protein